MGASDMPPRKGTKKTPEHRVKISAGHLARGIRLQPKRCPGCGETKDQSEFYQQADRTHSYCKKCSGTKQRQQRARDPEKTRENDRRQRLKRDYGLTLDDYDAMLHRQEYKCAICREVPSCAKPAFFVDHDHRTGYIRGLLCNTCNRGIGLLRDSPERLEAAATYLRRNRLLESSGVGLWADGKAFRAGTVYSRADRRLQHLDQEGWAPR